MSEFPLNPNRAQRALRLHRELDRVWRNEPGLRGWFSSVNHSTIGMRFMLTAIFFFGVAGILSMLIRVQLASAGSGFLDVALYNQFFTMHGTLMMFLFATPMFEGLAMYLLPRLLGARDLAYPRLSALGWWCYLFGGLILLGALIAGLAPDGGWFMYVPLSTKTYSPGINADVWLLGITFIEVSAIAAAVELTVTILRLRAPGMRLTEMPLMAWYLLGAALMMLVGFPPLILGSLLLELERAFDWPFFDVARGGDALLWQHLFWLFGHPEVYILFLPAAGIVSTVLPVMARTKMLGYGAIVAAILATVFLSFGLWVHHMFTVGIPHMALAFFSAASALVAVPTAVQVFLWIGTLWAGRPEMKLPMLYLTGFFGTFVMGGLTGVMLAIVPFNWQAHDTAFVTAHLHYVLIGGFVFPMMAGLTYWMPLISGRTALPRLGAMAFWTILTGFHGTFFLMHLTGLLGMPRRISSYGDHPEWLWLNLISSVFGFVMTIGFALFALSLILQALFGPRLQRNPWRAEGLEWQSPVFASNYNFASLPLPEQTEMLALARGEGALPGAPRALRETLVLDPVSGQPQHIAVMPMPTLLPLATALVICLFVLAMLAGAYPLAALALIGIILIAWAWGRPLFPSHDYGGITVLPGLSLTHHFHHRETLNRSGMICFMVANGSFFTSLLFGIAFLAVVAPMPEAPQSQMSAGHAWLGATCVLILFLNVLTARAALPGLSLALSLGAGLTALAILPGLDPPQLHARFALTALALAYVLLHLLIGAMLAAQILRQRRAGLITASRPGALALWQIWQGYTAVTALILFITLLSQRLLT